MKIYDILHSPHRTDLIDAVNEAMDDGWEPHGSMVVSYPPGVAPAMDYLQPIVKELRRDETKFLWTPQ